MKCSWGVDEVLLRCNWVLAAVWLRCVLAEVWLGYEPNQIIQPKTGTELECQKTYSSSGFKKTGFRFGFLKPPSGHTLSVAEVRPRFCWVVTGVWLRCLWVDVSKYYLSSLFSVFLSRKMHFSKSNLLVPDIQQKLNRKCINISCGPFFCQLYPPDSLVQGRKPDT